MASSNEIIDNGDIMKNIKKIMNKNMIISIIIFLVGLILFLKPDVTLKSITIVIGILLILLGSGPVIDLIKSKEKKLSFSIAPSIILFTIAFIFFFSPEILISIIPILIGVALVMSSAFKLQNIYNIKKTNNIFNIWRIVITLIILILGILLIINPFEGAIAGMKVIGMFLMIYSILDVIDVILIKKVIK